MKLKLRIGAKVAAAILGAAGVTLAIPMLPAVGQSSPPVAGIKLQSPAKIADKGAVVFVSALIACPAGDTPNVNVELTERSGHAIAEGDGFADPTCTGGIQTVSLAVSPQYAPFISGIAFGQGEIEDCNAFSCSQAFTQRNVKLTVKK